MLDDLFKRTEHLVQQSVECKLMQVLKPFKRALTVAFRGSCELHFAYFCSLHYSILNSDYEVILPTTLDNQWMTEKCQVTEIIQLRLFLFFFFLVFFLFTLFQVFQHRFSGEESWNMPVDSQLILSKDSLKQRCSFRLYCFFSFF